jgi:hypothetical protein
MRTLMSATDPHARWTRGGVSVPRLSRRILVSLATTAAVLAVWAVALGWFGAGDDLGVVLLGAAGGREQ